MQKPPDESQPLSSAALLADISDKLDRTLSTAAQASLQAARTVRIVNANMQLDARNRMALVDTVDSFKRNVQRLGQIAEQLSGGRPATLTVVQDVPAATEDTTGVVYIGKDGVRRFKVPGIPTKYLLHVVIMLLALAVAGGVLLGRMGVKPGDVVKATAPLVAP